MHIELKIENVYEDGKVTTHAEADVEPAPPENTPEWEDWEMDNIFPHTGTGKTEGESAYFVTVTACDDQSLVGREFEFGT